MGRVVQPWRDWKAVWMRHVETWISSGLGSAGEQLDLGISKAFSNLSHSGSVIQCSGSCWGGI